jgi:hypothetical protein
MHGDLMSALARSLSQEPKGLRPTPYYEAQATDGVTVESLPDLYWADWNVHAAIQGSNLKGFSSIAEVMLA